jgi:hypothetical protein
VQVCIGLRLVPVALDDHLGHARKMVFASAR